ncbi:MAG: S66 peptidase family protein [Armatimonadota bacterium]
MKPNLLQPGDTIGLIAPSKFVGKEDRDNLDQGILFLENQGFQARLSPNFWRVRGQSPGAIEERVSDIHTMFMDPQVRAIYCAQGGNSASKLLPHLNYDLIKTHPKILLGFSDNSHLLLAIYSKTSLVTFYAPSLTHLAHKTEQSQTQMLDLLRGSQVIYPRFVTTIRSGYAEGILIGGNLFVINSLSSSGYSPDYTNSILFIEDIDDAVSAIEGQLHQLKKTDILERISGLIIGHIETSCDLDRILDKHLSDYHFPIIKVDFFGHNISNCWSIPIGTRALIDTEANVFQLLEPAVLTDESHLNSK